MFYLDGTPIGFGLCKVASVDLGVDGDVSLIKDYKNKTIDAIRGLDENPLKEIKRLYKKEDLGLVDKLKRRFDNSIYNKAKRYTDKEVDTIRGLAKEHLGI